MANASSKLRVQNTDQTAELIDVTTLLGLGSSGLAWEEVTATTKQAENDKGYIANNTSRVMVTLPLSSAVGDRIAIVGKGSGGWGIIPNTGQTVHLGDKTTVSGDKLHSTQQYDCVELLCVEANTKYVMRHITGRVNSIASTLIWPDWSWWYPMTIQATKVSADLTNMLVMVDLADMGADFWTNLSFSDGRDIRAGNPTSGNPLPCYVASIDSAAKTGIVWVRYEGTVSSTTDTVFRLYNGNATATMPAVTDPYGRNNVFQDYRAFYGFEEDPSGTAPQLVDWTGNGNDGTANGSMTAADLVAGKIGNAWDFDGVDDRANLGAAPTFASDTQGAISFWVNFDVVPTSGNPKYIVGMGGAANSVPGLFAFNGHYNSTTGQPVLRYGTRSDGSSGSIVVIYGGTTLVVGTDYYCTLVSDGTTIYMYINGTAETLTVSAGSNNGNWFGDVSIVSGKQFDVGAGKYNGSYTGLFNGKGSGGYISNTAVTADRISAEYNNQNSPSTFYSVGAANANV